MAFLQIYQPLKSGVRRMGKQLHALPLGVFFPLTLFDFLAWLTFQAARFRSTARRSDTCKNKDLQWIRDELKGWVEPCSMHILIVWFFPKVWVLKLGTAIDFGFAIFPRKDWNGMEEDAAMMSDDAASSSVSSASASSVASKALDLVIAAVKSVSWPFYLRSVLDVLDVWASCLLLFFGSFVDLFLASFKIWGLSRGKQTERSKIFGRAKEEGWQMLPTRGGGILQNNVSTLTSFNPGKVLASLKEIGCPGPIQKVAEEPEEQEAAKNAKKKKGLGKKKKKAVKLGKTDSNTNSEEIGEYKAGD